MKDQISINPMLCWVVSWRVGARVAMALNGCSPTPSAVIGVKASGEQPMAGLGSLPNSHGWPKGAKCCVPTDANSCHNHPEVKELEVPKTCFGYPNINFLFGHHPIPIWERIPWPVSSSVPRPMMKPIIARRPFQVSAKDEKPNLLSIVSLKNLTIL